MSHFCHEFHDVSSETSTFTLPCSGSLYKRYISSNHFLLAICSKTITFAILTLPYACPETYLQTRRAACEATKLHAQFTCPGGFLSPIVGLHAAGSTLKAIVRRLKGRLCLSDTFCRRPGAPKSCLRPWFRSLSTADIKSNDAKASLACQRHTQAHTYTHAHIHE